MPRRRRRRTRGASRHTLYGIEKVRFAARTVGYSWEANTEGAESECDGDVEVGGMSNFDMQQCGQDRISLIMDCLSLSL